MKRVLPANPSAGGSCRTLKAQYWKTSVANLLQQGTFGATGAMVIYS